MAQDGRFIVVCGTTGAGKTYWTAKRVARRRRLLAYDPDGKDLSRGCHRYVGLAASVRAVLAVARTKQPAFRLSFVFPPDRVGDFLRILWAIPQHGGRPVTLVIDEFDDPTMHAKPGGRGVDEFLRFGRRMTDEVIVCGQRTALIPLRARTSAALMLQGATQNRADLTAVGETFGREAIDQVRRLKLRQFAQFGRLTESRGRAKKRR